MKNLVDVRDFEMYSKDNMEKFVIRRNNYKKTCKKKNEYYERVYKRNNNDDFVSRDFKGIFI